MSLIKFIQFEVRGRPVPQKRHRHNRKTGHVYDPSASDKKDFLAVAHAHAPETPIDGPVWLGIKFYMPIPKSVSKKKREALKDECTPHFKRPDTDNLVKLVKDALGNDVFWHDDCQIYSMYAYKYYSETPRTVIMVGHGAHSNRELI